MTGEEHKMKIWATIIIFYSSDSKSVDFCRWNEQSPCALEKFCIGVVHFSLSLHDFFVLITYRVFLFDICKHKKSSDSGDLVFIDVSFQIWGWFWEEENSSDFWLKKIFRVSEVTQIYVLSIFTQFPLKVWAILLWEVHYWLLVLWYNNRTQWKKSAFRPWLFFKEHIHVLLWKIQFINRVLNKVEDLLIKLLL